MSEIRNSSAGEWMDKLSAFYSALDEAIAARGWVCRGCGECCHFDQVDHVLYASELERSYLLANATQPQQPDGDTDLLAKGLRCPYQQDNRCTARQGRPLGCRLHFCEAEDDFEFYEMWHIRLKQLHSDTGQDWRYAPLLPLTKEEYTAPQ